MNAIKLPYKTGVWPDAGGETRQPAMDLMLATPVLKLTADSQWAAVEWRGGRGAALHIINKR